MTYSTGAQPGLRRATLVVLVSLVTVLLVAVTPASAASLLPSTTTLEADLPFAVGLSPGADLLYEPTAKMESDIRAMAAAGNHYMRIDINWGYVEPTPGVFNQANLTQEDNAIETAVGGGMVVDAMMAYAPSWALTGPNATPNATLFATFAQQMVQRYSPFGVNIYEVWNEPNLGYSWNNQVSPTSYGNFLKTAYNAIHAVSPNAVVLMGGLGRGPDTGTGLAMAPYTFLSQLYAGGFGPYFDAVNLHPYSVPDAPLTYDAANNPDFPRLPNYYSLMVANGDALKKIWITEYGYPTANDPNAVTESQQYNYLLQAIVAAMGQPYMGPFMLFTWQDDTSQSYGLLRQDGSYKPAFYLFEIAPHV